MICIKRRFREPNWAPLSGLVRSTFREAPNFWSSKNKNFVGVLAMNLWAPSIPNPLCRRVCQLEQPLLDELREKSGIGGLYNDDEF